MYTIQVCSHRKYDGGNHRQYYAFEYIPYRPAYAATPHHSPLSPNLTNVQRVQWVHNPFKICTFAWSSSSRSSSSSQPARQPAFGGSSKLYNKIVCAHTKKILHAQPESVRAIYHDYIFCCYSCVYVLYVYECALRGCPTEAIRRTRAVTWRSLANGNWLDY